MHKKNQRQSRAFALCFCAAAALSNPMFLLLPAAVDSFSLHVVVTPQAEASSASQKQRLLPRYHGGAAPSGRHLIDASSPAAVKKKSSRDVVCLFATQDDGEDRRVRVPRAWRRTGRRRYYDDDEENEAEGAREDAYYNDRERSNYYDDEDDDDGEYYDDEYDYEEIWDDDYEDDDDEIEIDTDKLIEDVVVPNPLLDSIDPDGAADRFPELARDPKFWIDMCLFIAFLNFLSFAGPRDPFPDLPWY